MKILCVCGTGQGSSLILKMSVQDILNRKGLQAELEHTDASCACSERCDFIITSQEIADSITNPRAKIVCITNYINKGIIEKRVRRCYRRWRTNRSKKKMGKRKGKNYGDFRYNRNMAF